MPKNKLMKFDRSKLGKQGLGFIILLRKKLSLIIILLRKKNHHTLVNVKNEFKNQANSHKLM